MFDSKQLEFCREMMSDMFDTFAKTHTLYYTSKPIPCGNCVYDPIGKKSSNKYKNGGPVPFYQGICPMCDGDGAKASEISEDIQGIIYWKIQKGQDASGNVKTPNYKLSIKIRVADFPKLKKCEYILIQKNIDGLAHHKCKLVGELVDNHNLIQDKYMIVYLERIG